MNTDEKLDMVIEMVAHMNEQMTMQFGEVGVKFGEIDKKIEQIDKRFEQIDNRFEQMDKRMDRMEEKFENFCTENAKEHEMMNRQIALITEILQRTTAENDARYQELKANDKELQANDEELKRVQRLHSADIAELRAAI